MKDLWSSQRCRFVIWIRTSVRPYNKRRLIFIKRFVFDISSVEPTDSCKNTIGSNYLGFSYDCPKDEVTTRFFCRSNSSAKTLSTKNSQIGKKGKISRVITKKTSREKIIRKRMKNIPSKNKRIPDEKGKQLAHWVSFRFQVRRNFIDFFRSISWQHWKNFLHDICPFSITLR